MNEHFNKLNSIDINNKVKTSQKQKYLPWVYAWGELKKLYPNASFKVIENSEGLPYFASSLGIMVKVEVTIEGETILEMLPVLNSSHKTLKLEKYSYLVKEYVNRQPTGKMIEKLVEAATMFDINTSIKRCMTKCIAMHGLGLYIFADDQMPEVELIDSSQLHEITNLCASENVMISDLTKAYGIEKVTHFHASTFDSAIQWIKENKIAR